MVASKFAYTAILQDEPCVEYDWYKIGIRLVFGCHTMVYGDVWWFTLVYGYGIRWHTVVYLGIRVRCGMQKTIGIRLVYFGLWVTSGYGIRLVYDWYKIGIQM